jgi:hypothetical protein
LEGSQYSGSNIKGRQGYYKYLLQDWGYGSKRVVEIRG